MSARGNEPDLDAAAANARELLLDRDGEQWVEPHEITDMASPDLIAARDVLALVGRVRDLEAKLERAEEVRGESEARATRLLGEWEAAEARVRDLETKRDEYGDLAARRQAMLLAAEARVAQLETALANLLTEFDEDAGMSVSINTLAKARAVLVSAGQGGTP